MVPEDFNINLSDNKAYPALIGIHGLHDSADNFAVYSDLGNYGPKKAFVIPSMK